MSSEIEHPAPDATPPGDAPTPPEPQAPANEAPTPADAAAVAAPPDAPAAEGHEREHDESAEESEATEGEATEASAEGEPGKKKKRRRKKKKKPAGEAGEETHEAGDEHAQKHRSHRPATERAPFHVGEEVFGKVTAVLDTAVMVDLSGKALAIFDRGEMEADDLVPSVGDRFVARIHNDGARGGLVVLTRKPLREEEIKPAVEAAAKEGSLVQGLITGVIKGGVEVDINGLRAFAPASGMDLHPQNANFTGLVGQRLEFKVIQYKNAGRDVVVSRRPMLEAEAHERRKHALTLLSEGQVLKGLVRTVVDWGRSSRCPRPRTSRVWCTSPRRATTRARMADLMKPGDSIEVKILKIDEKGKIWLSRKALIEDPWAPPKRSTPAARVTPARCRSSSTSGRSSSSSRGSRASSTSPTSA
ncbi:MAG: S1 RNA-binding domain-containing protein [Polyangiaceae bacterium]